MSRLGEVLELMHEADRRVSTVRATVREWWHHGRIDEGMERHAVATGATRYSTGVSLGAPAPLVTERRDRLWWRAPDHLRVESVDPSGISAPETRVHRAGRWHYHTPAWGLTEDGAEGGGWTSYWPPRPLLLEPALLIVGLRLSLVGEVEVAGRPGVALAGTPRGTADGSAVTDPGADDYRVVIDAERGIALVIAALIDGEEMHRREVPEVAFDEPLEESLFVLRPPPGERPRRAGGLTPRPVTLWEAAGLAPFTLLAPRRVPAGVELSVSFIAAEPPWRRVDTVMLEYASPDARLRFTVGLTAVADSDIDDVVRTGERIERDGRTVIVRDMGGQRQLVADRLGTRAFLLTETLPMDVMIDVAASLEPVAPEPPALVGA